MTDESNYILSIAMLCDWLKNLAPVFRPMTSKTKANHTSTRDFFRALSKLREIARNCD